jgi:hypothetical protein
MQPAAPGRAGAQASNGIPPSGSPAPPWLLGSLARPPQPPGDHRDRRLGAQRLKQLQLAGWVDGQAQAQAALGADVQALLALDALA